MHLTGRLCKETFASHPSPVTTFQRLSQFLYQWWGPRGPRPDPHYVRRSPVPVPRRGNVCSAPPVIPSIDVVQRTQFTIVCTRWPIKGTIRCWWWYCGKCSACAVRCDGEVNEELHDSGFHPTPFPCPLQEAGQRLQRKCRFLQDHALDTGVSVLLLSPLWAQPKITGIPKINVTVFVNLYASNLHRVDRKKCTLL